MRFVQVTLLTAVVLCCAPLGEAQDTIYITVTGISCNSPGKASGEGMQVSSWQMGFGQAGNPSPGAGAGAGKATFQPLTVTRPFDECSPQLLPKLFNGRFLSTVTLTQYSASHGDTAGVPLMVVTLTNAAISNYTIGGNATNDPAETWTFNTEKICVKNVTNNIQACWDFVTNAP